MVSIGRSDFIRALAADEIVPFVQPMVDLRSGRVVGFEALARWLHPQAGLLLPEQFIGFAQTAPLIWKLTEQVMSKACRAASSWPAHMLLSINIAPLQLRERMLPQKLAGVAARAGFPLSRLMIEITETGIIGNYDHTRAVCEELKCLGALIALDDFGTGYSSLTHVHELPLDKLKIDSSFVRSMAGRRESRKIVAAVVGLGHSLGLSTVAEGVEQEAQADMLGLLGCDHGQGWLFGKPIPLIEAPGRIAEPAWNVASRLRQPDPPTDVALSLEALSSQRLTLLRAIYNGSPVGLCFLDRGRRYLTLNKKLAEMNGLPVAAHLGRTVDEIMPDASPVLEQNLARALAGEDGIEFEMVQPLRAGEPAIFLISLQPVFDEVAEVVGVSAAVIDISERARVQERLQESEDHYRHMVELSPHIPWTADASGFITDVSTRWATLTGIGRQSSLGMGWAAAIHLDDIAPALMERERAMRMRDQLDIELRIRVAGGEYRWMRARATPRFKEDGGILCWYGLAEDVHDRVLWRAATAARSLPAHAGRGEFDAAIAAAGDVFSIASIGLDGFEGVADRLGAAASELLLCAVAERLEANIRRLDVLARTGGGGLALCMPLLSLADAMTIAERLRRVVADAPFDGATGSIAVSISIGVAVAETFDPQPGAALDRAASALLGATMAGGDRVACAGRSMH